MDTFSQSPETGRPENFSEKDILLASNNPKKRAGRKKFKETRHPVYRGVRQRNSGKWVCEVREPNKKSRIWLGTYLTPEMAARAHDVAAIALRGPSACLNFADSAWRLPVPASAEANDIQKAAAEAAEAFRPTEAQKSDHVVVPQNIGDVAAGEEDNMVPEWEKVFNMNDDDEVYPGYIDDMAMGMMLPPPCQDYHNEEWDVDVSLWNHSISNN